MKSFLINTPTKMKSREHSYYKICCSLSVAAAILFPLTDCFYIEVLHRNTRRSTAAFNDDPTQNPAISLHPNFKSLFFNSARKRKSLATVSLSAGSFSSNDGGGEDEDGEEVIDLSDQDWRNFRAKLVMNEPNDSIVEADNMTPTTTSLIDDPDDLDGIGDLFSQNPSKEKARERFNIVSEHWAYESGNIIEEGAVILGGVEQEFGFGLRQQYFHKAAILILFHDENLHTKGIILNRPSDQIVIDPDNPGVKWRIWFGGDVQGIDSWNPEIICLHSLESESASKVSTQVMKSIKWTSFEEAKRLVKIGEACPSDFWVFCGYAGWAPKQLMGELERKSWYMVATDSQTLLLELARQASAVDPRDSGLDTWKLLMRMIGREEIAKETIGDFDDLMLKEWARRYLILKNVLAAQEQLAVRDGASTRELLGIPAVDKLLKKTANFFNLQAGMLVRASSAERSPFLLDKQQLHKSIVLLISDDDDMSIGVMLNRPTPNSVEMSIVDQITGEKRTVAIPVRYGGEYAVRGRAPLLWLHCNEKMRTLGIGAPLGAYTDPAIWTCHPDQVTKAIEQNLAKPNDFMVVSGVTVWTKGEKSKIKLNRGLQGEVIIGNFEVVQSSRIPFVFQTLLTQEVLSGVNLFKILAIANDAWAEAVVVEKGVSNKECISAISSLNGIGDGYDEDDDSLVYKSKVRVISLADDALRSWMSTFLLFFTRQRKGS